MKQLNDLLKLSVIPALQSGLLQCVFDFYGLIIPVQKGSEVLYVELDDDSKLCRGVHPNDKADLWAAMRCNVIETEVLSDVGKKKRYLAKAKVNLICYSKTFRLAQDYVVSRLSSVPNLSITSISNDSYRALELVSGAKNYNIQHDLFVISFDYTYKSDFCTVLTLTKSEDC